MKDLKEFDISFIGLKEGIHQFDYKIEKEFFYFFNYEEFYNSNVNVNLSPSAKTISSIPTLDISSFLLIAI